jgi:hypothetical protein
MAKTKKLREPGGYNPEMKWVRRLGPKLYQARPFIQGIDLGTRYGQHFSVGTFGSRREARLAAFKFVSQKGQLRRPSKDLPKWVFLIKPRGYSFRIRIPVLSFTSREVYATRKRAFQAAARMIIERLTKSPTNYGGYRTRKDFRPVLYPDRAWWDEVERQVKREST